jgi:hypothetical protein
MVTDFVELCSSRATRNLLVVSLMLFAGIAAALALNGRFFYNVLTGPFAIDNSTLTSLTAGSDVPQYFVTVNGSDSMDTGVDEMITHSRRGASAPKEMLAAHYLTLAVGKRVLLVRSPSNKEVLQFTGTLQPVPVDVQHKVIDDIAKAVPKAKGLFLPVMLNVEDIRAGGYIELVLGITLLLLAAWNLARVLRRQLYPKAQPIYKTLSAYGPADAVARAIDAEVSGPGCVHIGKAVITPHWLLLPRRFSLQVIHLDDVIWAYQKTTVQQGNLIKTGEVYTASLWTKRGDSIDVAGKQTDVTSLLVQVAHRAPWVLTGFSKERDKSWRTNRQFVIQTVLDRQRYTKMRISSEV